MRICAFVCLAALAALPFALPLSAQDCPELKPTLRQYYIQQWGQRYVDSGGGIPEPSDSNACEKLRYDARVYICRHRQNDPSSSVLNLDKSGMPAIVVQAQRAKAHRVGGPEAKRRNIQRAWGHYRKAKLRSTRQRARQIAARAGYQATVQKLKVAGCKQLTSMRPIVLD